ncbi:LuxR C-terminal-related transcriptional regulator [Streptomyces venezuelae]|uniref:LuxR C-terminal-related transcriptional regulator n=1 Tax=Streptomyces venezuelae TaxID=54571 RepID=UPI00362DB369
MTSPTGRRQGRDGRLAVLGVTPAEERLYRRLLEAGPVSLDRLATGGGPPQAELEQMLGTLVRRGLVTAAADGSGRWCPLPPQVAVEPLIRSRERELSAARRALLSLVAEHRSDSRAPRCGPVELLDEAAMTRRWAEVEAGVERELLVLSKAPFLGGPGRTAQVLDVLARRVECRCVYDRSALDRPGALRSVNEFHEAGEQVRFADRLPVKLMVADRRVALLPAGPEQPGFWLSVRASDLLDGLVTLFELIWSRSVPLQDGTDHAGVALLGDDAQLLSLLVGGMTDAAIARQLGSSVRTVQRRVNRLMRRAGAHSRAQLAWQAARQSWLQAPEDQGEHRSGQGGE